MDRYEIALEKPLPPSEQIYAGWIEASICNEKTLREMGVTGKIEFNKGIYEYCDITEKIGLALKKRFGKKFYLGSFTAIDSNGNSLPKSKQFFHNLKEEK